MWKAFAIAALGLGVLTAGQFTSAGDASARGRGSRGIELGPNSCFWVTRNWNCRPR